MYLFLLFEEDAYCKPLKRNYYTELTLQIFYSIRDGIKRASASLQEHTLARNKWVICIQMLITLSAGPKCETGYYEDSDMEYLNQN